MAASLLMLRRGCCAVLLAGLAAHPAVAQPGGPPAEPEPILRGNEVVFEPFKPNSPTETFYPGRAQRLDVQGQAMMLCDIRADFSLSCVTESENPPNMGFGDAAARFLSESHVRPQTKTGESVIGRRLRIPYTFKLSGPPAQADPAPPKP